MIRATSWLEQYQREGFEQIEGDRVPVGVLDIGLPDRPGPVGAGGPGRPGPPPPPPPGPRGGPRGPPPAGPRSG
jgi:hypothetical protein